jgi:hypothetical protein
VAPNQTAIVRYRGGSLVRLGNDERDERGERQRSHDRAATRSERAARGEREAAEASDALRDDEGAERHREEARRLEADADDERHQADDER